MTAVMQRPAELPPVPYTLSDMAADGIGLLDSSRHRPGAHRRQLDGRDDRADDGDRAPEPRADVTSIMSRTGDPESAAPTPEAAEALLAPPPTGPGRLHRGVAELEVWASKKLLRRRRGCRSWRPSYDRCFYPEGATRQLAAIYASGNRAEGAAGADGADARDPRPRRHADHAGAAASAPPSSSPAPTCSCCPTWATTCPQPLWPVLADASSPPTPRVGLTARTHRHDRHRTNERTSPWLDHCTGYRIIEIAGIGPGPFAAMLLADMGAEVDPRRARPARARPAARRAALRRPARAVGATSRST